MALVVLLIFSSFSYANYDRVFSLGILGQGGANLDGKLSREQLATVAVRLMGIEYLKDSYNNKSNFKDVSGWALPYVNMAYENNIISGVSKDKFDPNGDVTYIQVLTVLMRLLGYKDNIDFTKFPDDYYNKALEIGLGNLYIPYDEVVTRETMAITIERFFDLKIKDMVISYYDYMGMDVPKEIKIENISFNTSIVGSFSGNLKGDSDFSQYKIGVYSRNGSLYKMVNPEKNGKFSITGFDNSIMAKLSGYKYIVYDSNMNLILSGNLD